MIFTQLAGRLGSEPEVRYTPGGLKVTSFRMAVNHRRGGEETTVWISVNLWGDQYDKMVTYLKKGSAVIVNGRLRPPRVYNDRNGNAQAALDVDADNLQFSPFGKPSDEENTNRANSYTTSGSNPAQAPQQPSYQAAAPAPQYQAATPAPSSPGATPAPMYNAYSADPAPAAAPEPQRQQEHVAASSTDSSFQEDDLPF